VLDAVAVVELLVEVAAAAEVVEEAVEVVRVHRSIRGVR
jgi:hypothetical protein